jgi:hypothetical protein
MPSTLHLTIQTLANDFAAAVLDAIRSASLDDLLAETKGRGVRANSGGGQPDPPS